MKLLTEVGGGGEDGTAKVDGGSREEFNSCKQELEGVTKYHSEGNFSEVRLMLTRIAVGEKSKFQ